MNRRNLFCLFFLFFAFKLSAQIKNFFEYRLENGLSVFILEDFSSATVNIDFCVKAGISSQTRDNTGFFTLFSRILDSSLKNSENLYIFKNSRTECNSDSTKISVKISSFNLKKACSQIADSVFFENFSNNLIKTEFSKLKTEVMEYSQSPECLINSSIDSRVFYEEPWKYESGVFTSLFDKIEIENARNILENIRKTYFIPEKAAIFVSGAVNSSDALKIIREEFSKVSYSKKNQISEELKIKNQKNKKFVIQDSVFSEDLNHLIVLYKNIPYLTGEIISNALNFQNSNFMQEIQNDKRLKNISEDFANVSVSYKNKKTRMLFQILLENSGNSITEQTEIFAEKIKKSVESLDENSFDFAKQILIEKFNENTKNSEDFMKNFINFWVSEEFIFDKEIESEKMVEKFINSKEITENIQYSEIKNILNEQNPYIFLVINSETYKKFKKEFKKSDFTEINDKNSAWYKNELYKKASDLLNQEKNLKNQTEKTSKDYVQEFVEKNISGIQEFRLKNKIPVVLKKNEFSDSVEILLGIKVGKLSENVTLGFNSVMINAFAQNIQNEIEKNQNSYEFLQLPNVLAQTENIFSTISVECNKNDSEKVIECIYSALVQGEIFPYQADSLIYFEKTQKRLYNASPVNQLTEKAVNSMFKSKIYKKTFDSKSEILDNIDYTEILKNYPKFLNPELFNFVICGNFDSEKIENKLNVTFCNLPEFSKKTEKNEDFIEIPDFSRKKLSVKIAHYFYTDVKKEDAGPMPKILVPTTEFFDPAQIWLKSPEFSDEEFEIFNAINNYLVEKINKNLEKSEICEKVSVQNATKELNVSNFTFFKVKNKNKIQEIFNNSVEELKSGLKENAEINLEMILNFWVMENFSKNQTNREVALLLNKGFQNSENCKKYLEDYKKITSLNAEKCLSVLEKYFSSANQLMIYSKD